MITFPNEKEVYDFMNIIYKSESGKIGMRKQYEFIKEYNDTPEEFLNNIDRNRELSKKHMKSYHNTLSYFIIFLSLKFNIKPNCDIQALRIYYAQDIINYFNLVPSNFRNAMDEKVKGSYKRKQSFLVQIIKSLVYLEKRNITEVTDDDLLRLRNKDFFKGSAKSEHFPVLLQSVLGIINKRSLGQRLSGKLIDKKDYGSNVEDITVAIQAYLNNNYINRGFKEDSPLISIRLFFKWLHKNYNITTLNDISCIQWEKYKKFIENSDLKNRTKQVRTDMVSRFFKWLRAQNVIKENIVEIEERYRGVVKCKPRAFNSREDYIKILKATFDFEPTNDDEWLAKQFIIVSAATGLRKSEVLWLGPECLIEEDDETGEVLVQIKEKLGVKNKMTSVLKWGIKSLKELNLRFEKLPNKIKFYNSKTNEYFYSIFQANNGFLITAYCLQETFKKIMSLGNVLDQNGEPINLESVKFHGFRHQKFNDIYCVTNGSLTAVKVDSGHQTIKMAKTYIQQNEKQRQQEALELIAKGKVVGKGSEIIKALIQTPYSAQRYLEIVKK